MLAASLSYFVAVGVLIPALPLFVENRLAGGSFSVGVAVGAFSFSALLLRPFAGRWADARGRRLVMLAGAGLVALSVVGYLAAQSLSVLIALRLLTGAGEALFFVGALSTVGDLAPAARRGEAMSLFTLGPYAGIAIGPAIGEAAVGGDRFWVAWTLAASCAALAALVASRIPETRAPSEGSRPRGALIHRAALLPGGVLLTSWVSFTGFAALVPLYAREVGLGDSRATFVTFSVIMLTIAVWEPASPTCSGPGGRLERRWLWWRPAWF